MKQILLVFICIVFFYSSGLSQSIKSGYWRNFNYMFLSEATSICIDNDKVYVGTRENGFSIFYDNQWETFKQPITFFSNGVRDILKETEGKIWLATIDGLALRENEEFTHYHTGNSLPGNIVSKLLIDSENNLWFKIMDHGIGKFDGVDFTFFNESNSPLSADVGGIGLDASGNLWVGCNDFDTVSENFINWLCKYDGENWDSIPQDAPGMAIAIEYDKNNDLWFNLFMTVDGDKNLLKYDGTDWDVVEVRIDTSNYNWGSALYNLSVDNERNLWLHWSQYGMTKYDGENWTHYYSQDGFPDEGTRDLVQDTDGAYWIASESEGVFKWYDYPANIEMNNRTADLLIFPNPNNGRFEINSNQKINKIQIYNLLGKMLIESSNIQNPLDFSGQLNTGIYIFKIDFVDSSTSLEKVIITN